MSNKITNILAAAIMVSAVALAVTSVWDDSLIVDEIPHIGAGYSYIAKQDARLNPEHPPLAKILAGIPLLFLNLKETAFETKFWQTDVNGQWEFGRNLIYNSGNDANRIGHFAKLPMLLFFIFAGILLFLWAKKLYGHSAALITLFLFSFSPTVLAHSRFVTTDVPALFGVVFGTYFFINYLKEKRWRNFWLASIAFGIALLTKFSLFLLAPYFLILAIVWAIINHYQGSTSISRLSLDIVIRSVLSAILIFIVGVAVVVWPVYFFTTYHYPAVRQKTDTANLLQSYGNRALAKPVIWASDKPAVRALAGYGLGLLMVNQRAVGGNTTYFLGEVSRFGWKHYFPVVYFIKEPLAWWGLVIMAIIIAGKSAIHLLENSRATSRGSRVGRMADLPLWFRNHFTEFAMLLWLAIYWGISIKSTLNIGVRHLLPTYPFAILLVSGQLTKLAQNLKRKAQSYNSKLKILNFKLLFFVFSFTLFFLLSWYILENLKNYPYYLTYFNQTVGGPAGGHNFVTDSNLDWGQDLKRFSQWVKNRNIKKIELDYFGWANPSYYLGSFYIWSNSQKYKNAEDFRVRNQSNGWLAVSATFLAGSQGPSDKPNVINYLWLKNYKPVATVGHSIFIYRIR